MDSCCLIPGVRQIDGDSPGAVLACYTWMTRRMVCGERFFGCRCKLKYIVSPSDAKSDCLGEQALPGPAPYDSEAASVLWLYAGYKSR